MEMRRILFGYQKDHNGFHIIEYEAETVNQIFSLYLSGESMSKIARELTANHVAYDRDRTLWNKNMVARILENITYCGNEMYPQIVSCEIFRHAQEMKGIRCSYRKDTVSSDIAFLKKHVFCAFCGKQVQRNKQKNGRFRWQCINNCMFSRPICDEDVSAALKRCLLQAKMDKATITPQNHISDSGYTPSLSVQKHENELNRLLDQGGLSFQKAAQIIMNLISEKYQCCSLIPGEAYTNELHRQILQINETAPAVHLLETSVQRVIVGERELSIEFRNGAMWEDKED